MINEKTTTSFGIKVGNCIKVKGLDLSEAKEVIKAFAREMLDGLNAEIVSTDNHHEASTMWETID